LAHRLEETDCLLERVLALMRGWVLPHAHEQFSHVTKAGSHHPEPLRSVVSLPRNQVHSRPNLIASPGLVEGVVPTLDRAGPLRLRRCVKQSYA
jgi:hypothetical protein